MSKKLESIQDIVFLSQEKKLYAYLIQQINKDFAFANIHTTIDENSTPNQLIISLQKIVLNLLQERFSDCLNLLYRIDISEEQIKQLELEETDTIMLSKKISFLILKRIWEKVWFRNIYSK